MYYFDLRQSKPIILIGQKRAQKCYLRVTNGYSVSYLTAKSRNYQKIGFVKVKPSFLQNKNGSEGLSDSHAHSHGLYFCCHLQLHCRTCWQTLPHPTAKCHSPPFFSPNINMG